MSSPEGWIVTMHAAFFNEAPSVADRRRRRRVHGSLAAASAILLSAGALAVAGPARAGTVTVGLGGYSALIVDQAHNRLFISGPASSVGTTAPGGVVTTSLAGGSSQPVDGVTATGPMALAPDGGTVYVLGQDRVQAIDTGTFAVSDLPISTVGCLSGIAASSGHVWVGYGCDAARNPDAGLAVIDVDTGTVTTDVQPAPVIGMLQLASVPAAPDTIAMLASGNATTPTRLTMLSIDAGTINAAPSTDLGSIFGQALGLSPDGSKVAAGGDGLLAEFATATLTPIRTISLDYPDSPPGQPTGGVATSIAYSPDGSVLAMTGGFQEVRGSTSYAYGAVVRTYRDATGAFIRQYDYRQGYSGETVINDAGPQALAWVGATLWATFVNYLGERPTAHLLTDAAQSPSTATLTGPTSATRGRAVTLTGTLTSGGSAVVGAVLTITRTDMDGRHTLAATTTGSTGRFAVTDMPTVGAANTYAVSYAGDDTRGATTKAFTVTVSRVLPALTLITDKSRYVTGQTVRVTAHLGATYRNRTVTILLAQYPGKYVTLRRTTVDRHGNATASYRVTTRATVKVEYAGDERYLPRAAYAVRSVAGKAAMSVTRSYGRSGHYHLFHVKTGATVVGSAAPRTVLHSVGFELQIYYRGKWRTGDGESFPIGATGKTGRITVLGSRGYSFRLRALTGPAYVNSTVVLTSGTTGWYYLKFR